MAVSHQTIADAAGVTRATVSLALLDHPRISAATRERIQRIARELGYQPHAEMARLMSLIRSGRPIHDRPVMGLLTDTPEPLGRSGSPTWEGFRARAEELGYLPEEFRLTPEISPERITRILQTRAIRCLVISGLRQPSLAARLDLTGISAAHIGHVVHTPALSRTTSDKYGNTLLACERLWQAGARRIALVVPAWQEERVDYTFLSGYLVFHHLHHHAGWRQPLVFEDDWHIPRILAWLKKSKPDAIVAAYPGLECPLAAQSSHPPLIACVNVLEPGLRGIDQNHARIAAGAVDLVDAQFKRNETGTPATPKTMLIPGSWVEPPARPAGSNAASQHLKQTSAPRAG